MSQSMHDNLRRVLEGPLQGETPVATLGHALWLYLALVRGTNDRGLVCQTRSHLAEDLFVPEERIETWLARLARANLIRIHAPSPFLVIRLRLWSAEGPRSQRSHSLSSSESGLTHIEVPVGSGKQAAAASTRALGDGRQGEGVGLLAEVQEAIGPIEDEDLGALLTRYALPIVRRALQRVRATPQREIRKSKLALFRFLLSKFSDESHAHTPTHHHHT